MNKEQINTIFSTSECLTEQELLNYVNNNLTNVERNKVEQHTINCKFCSEALRVSRSNFGQLFHEQK